MGEAHRHEPPVPHDKVVVDEGQDREGAAEKERASQHVDDEVPGGKGQVAPPLPDSGRERGALVVEPKGDLPKGPQKVPEGNGPRAVEPVKEDQEPVVRDLHPGPQAVPPEGQDALGAGAADRADGVPVPDHTAGKPRASPEGAGFLEGPGVGVGTASLSCPVPSSRGRCAGSLAAWQPPGHCHVFARPPRQARAAPVSCARGARALGGARGQVVTHQLRAAWQLALVHGQAVSAGAQPRQEIVECVL